MEGFETEANFNPHSLYINGEFSSGGFRPSQSVFHVPISIWTKHVDNYRFLTIKWSILENMIVIELRVVFTASAQSTTRVEDGRVWLSCSF